MTVHVRSGWELVGTDPFSPDYHPTFTGNGFFAARVPAAGQGYAGRPVETQFPIAGLFGEAPPFQVRAGAPAWTGLGLSDASGAFSDAFTGRRAGRVDEYRQSLDLATGAITTSARWTALGGDVYAVRYTLLTDRADDRRAVVRLDVRAEQDSEIVVSDVLDARCATLVDRFSSSRDADASTVTLATELRGTALTSVLASTLRGPGRPEAIPADALSAHSIGQSLSAVARAGEDLTFVKYIGVAVDTPTRSGGVDRAAEISRAAADDGFDTVREGNDRAWARLWRGDILVAGDPLLQEQIRASRFYLLASVSANHPWSPSPAGLSSDGYGGHVFWDTETWMWPSVLLSDPEIAAAILQYRSDRVDDAARAAAAADDAGIRFPWEGALDGAEHTPATEFGETELHVISDVALACWQYYLATGDHAWLEHTGAEIIIGAADFWSHRAVVGEDGEYHIAHVTPPDEWAQAHDDSAYTNAAAAQVCRFAVRVCEILGRRARPEWSALAEAIHLPHDPVRDVVREHADYAGQRIKQADVVMLTYPWQHAQDPALTARNLDYYATKVTEWGGPSMTDAMHAIVSAELGRGGDAFWYTRRCAAPFLRAPFQQFAEERDGGAFTFVTGAGGFLQVFLYGYTGLRLREDGIDLAPLLPPPLTELTLTGLHHRGSEFDLTIGGQRTEVTVTEGGPLTVHIAGTVHEATTAAPVSFATRPSIDTGPDRGHGTLLASVQADRGGAETVASDATASAFPRDAFEVTALELFADGDRMRLVATVSGEIANPWAGEGMSAQELHVYLSDHGAAQTTTPGLPGLAADTPHPWALAFVASGLRQGAPSGTGVYDASGSLLGEVRVTVARRREIVLTVAADAVDGLDLASMRVAAVMLDASGGHPVVGDAPSVLPAGRIASVFTPVGGGLRPHPAPGARSVLPSANLERVVTAR